MVSVKVKVYSALSKFYFKRQLQALIENPISDSDPDPNGVVSRPGVTVTPAIPSFSGVDLVATKDIHIDSLTSLCVRIFLPDTAVVSSNSTPKQRTRTPREKRVVNESGERNDVYSGYSPKANGRNKKLPVILHFHGGGWVSGGVDTASNDAFCRRMAKLCDAVVVSVGYRLAPESRFPAAFEDGLKVLNWLANQANLSECSQSFGDWEGGGRRVEIADGFGTMMVEPWLAAHADPSRCVLLGVSCGANIANYVAKKSVEAGNLLDPVRVVAQVLMYPFFIGNTPTESEIRLANSYLYDKAMSIFAWKLFLPLEEESNLDHPAANPLSTHEVPLRRMPPTLTVVADHDWMRDRAIAYSQELRKVNVDAPLLDYKDTVHEFATLDFLLHTPQAQACSEDISIWMRKYISLRGNEFSY